MKIISNKNKLLGLKMINNNNIIIIIITIILILVPQVRINNLECNFKEFNNRINLIN